MSLACRLSPTAVSFCHNHADQAAWDDALRTNSTGVLVDLYAKSSPPHSFTLADWQKLIGALLLHRKKNRYILRLVSDLSLKELLSLHLSFDIDCMSALFRENCSNVAHPGALSKLLVLGAQFEQESLQRLIESIEREGDSQSLGNLIHIVHRLSPENAKKLLECYLSINKISHRIFAIQKFPSQIVHERLFHHATSGNALCIEKLLLHGVDIDVKDAEGKSALVHAVANGHLEVANLLLISGAEADQALPIARDQGILFADFCNDAQEQATLLPKLKQDVLLSLRLSVRAIRELALILFKNFPHIQPRDYYHEKRELYARSFSLFYCNRGTESATHHALYILMKSRGSLNARATYKKATEALLIPITKAGALAPAHDMVQVITKKELLPDQLAAASAEMHLQASLDGVEGVWHITDRREYFERGLRRITTFAPRAIDLSNYWTHLNIFQRLKVMKQLVKGLQNLHQRGIFHGDIKDRNCLIRLPPNGQIEASWNDFGFSFRPGEDPLNNIMTWGFYGCLEATAPELLGIGYFNGDFYLLEVYALGCMFYELYFGQPLPWENFLSDCYKELKGKKVLEADRRYLKTCVKEFVEMPLEKLSEESDNSLTAEEFAKKLFLQMMRLNAGMRLSLNDCYSGLTKLEEKHHQTTNTFAK